MKRKSLSLPTNVHHPSSSGSVTCQGHISHRSPFSILTSTSPAREVEQRPGRPAAPFLCNVQHHPRPSYNFQG